MAEKFHSDADKMVYQPRVLESDNVEEASDASEKKTTPAKSASPKKES